MTKEIDDAVKELEEVLAFYKSGNDEKSPSETGRIIGYEECIRVLKEKLIATPPQPKNYIGEDNRSVEQQFKER